MEENKKDEKLEACLARIRELVAKTVEESKAREEDERAAGKILENNPVARQMAEAQSRDFGRVPEGSEYFQRFVCPSSFSGTLYLFTGTTRYLESRRQWKAYQSAVDLLCEVGRQDEDPLYTIFHYVPGVMIFVTNQDRILAGIRSRQLAGTHVGMVSFPAGLVKPGELLEDAAWRQLGEESGIHHLEVKPVAVDVRNPDAPQTTYCFKGVTKEHELHETFEAEGKTFIWVSVRDCLDPAIAGDMRPMIAAFRARGINVPDDLRIAPDALEGLKGWGFWR